MPQPKPERIFSVFVSSTSADLERYRERARDVILTLNLRPIAMEYFPAQSRPTTDALTRYLAMADVIIFIAGPRYGSRTDNISFVEWEFNEAVRRGLPRLCLVMKDFERSAVTVESQDRELQERFIGRLRESSMVDEFDEATFERVLSGALNHFLQEVPKDAGLVRFRDYCTAMESASAQLHAAHAESSLFRFISGLGLIREHLRLTGGGERKQMSTPSDERVFLQKLLDLLDQNLKGLPVTRRMIDRLMRRLISRLHEFSGKSGFSPESLPELEIILDELFSDTLSTLQATSIHSSRDPLSSYQGYWHDPELGPFFKQKNDQYLGRRSARKLLRVFVCDSLAASVAEEWFQSTVMHQVAGGANVKIVEVDDRRMHTYEDFGVYQHGSAKNPAGAYLLLAPRDQKVNWRGLITSVTADSTAVEAYKRKFRDLWEQTDDELSILHSDRVAEAASQPLVEHGSGRIEDLFGRKIILRRLERLDTGERILSTSGFVRKYQPSYAKAISDHLKVRLPHVQRLVYVGDTHTNDGTAIRNLQKLDWNVSGFICEPSLGLERLWFNNVLYASHWTDLVEFKSKIEDTVGASTLAIFDIDQTLWAPKGVHESPLTMSRTRAIARLVDDYVADSESDVAKRAKERIDLVYRELSNVRYLPLTLDNEDFKAVICVSLALNLIFDQQRLERSDREAGAAFFEELGRLEARDFLAVVRDSYLPAYLKPEGGEANITRFIVDAQATSQTNQYPLYGETNGILVARLGEHLRDVFRETVGTAPIQYAAFRAKELEEALGRAVGGGNLNERLVLNKPAWDFAMWLKDKDCELLALSDRPDESTVSPSGESLLNAEMTIYGRAISMLL